MTKKLLFLAVAILLQYGVYAVSDWSTQVAPILYNHCTSCHHDGGIAPFSLLTYDDAVLYASSISHDISIHKMPPWQPDPAYSHMAYERILSPTDITTITNWVTGGTPQGNLALAPPIPVYANHGMIPGTPDLKVKIPTYTSTASASGDVYQCFVIPSGLLTDKYIKAFEAIPGNPACVHHVLVFADTTGKCAALQAASTTGPGYPDFGGVGQDSASMLGVWVPGSQPMSYPAGFGLKIPHHADIVVQIHYPAGTVGMVDSTEVHFFFAPAAGIREVVMEPILYHDLDLIGGPLNIPANTIKTYQEEFPSFFLPATGITLLGAFPHMHLIGKTIKSYAVLPSGDTDNYIRINNWDFHWQGFYMFPKMKVVPPGTRMRAEATYDNTAANPENPYNPPRDISVGENTTNEMMIVFFVFTTYQAGDENIVIDSTILSSPNVMYNNYYHGQQLLDVCPNPVVSNMVVKCFLEDQDVGSIELLDMQGRSVRSFMTNAHLQEGYSAFTYSVSGLPPGTYNLVFKTSQQMFSKKIVVIQ